MLGAVEVETCMECWNSRANAAIMWQCVPVPVFGNHKSSNVRMATVGLNPSATEFLNDEGDWKPETERLPLVTDFGVRERDCLNAEHIERASNLRAEYFQRPSHSFFSALQGLLSAVNAEWKYVTGTAVHVDLVACGTWRAWSHVSQGAKGELVRNCQKHLIRTLGELPRDTVLLFDGKTACEEVAGAGAGILQNLGHYQDREGKDVTVRFSSGNVTVADRSHKFAAWNYPANRLSKDALSRIAMAAL